MPHVVRYIEKHGNDVITISGSMALPPGRILPHRSKNIKEQRVVNLNGQTHFLLREKSKWKKSARTKTVIINAIM